MSPYLREVRLDFHPTKQQVSVDMDRIIRFGPVKGLPVFSSQETRTRRSEYLRLLRNLEPSTALEDTITLLLLMGHALRLSGVKCLGWSTILSNLRIGLKHANAPVVPIAALNSYECIAVSLAPFSPPVQLSMIRLVGNVYHELFST